MSTGDPYPGTGTFLVPKQPKQDVILAVYINIDKMSMQEVDKALDAVRHDITKHSTENTNIIAFVIGVENMISHIDCIYPNDHLNEDKVEEIKKKLSNQDKSIELVFNYLDELIEKQDNSKPKKQIGFKIPNKKDKYPLLN